MLKGLKSIGSGAAEKAKQAASAGAEAAKKAIAPFLCNATVNPGGAMCYQYGLLSAPSWRGPWHFVRMLEIYGEDAYVWRDHRGSFHMLWQGGSYTPQLPQYEGHFHVAWSRDGVGWTVNTWAPAYGRYPNIPLTNGSVFHLRRRERQQ
eukprot:gene38500-58568_t